MRPSPPLPQRPHLAEDPKDRRLRRPEVEGEGGRGVGPRGSPLRSPFVVSCSRIFSSLLSPLLPQRSPPSTRPLPLSLIPTYTLGIRSLRFHPFSPAHFRPHFPHFHPPFPSTIASIRTLVRRSVSRWCSGWFCREKEGAHRRSDSTNVRLLKTRISQRFPATFLRIF